MVSAFRKSVTRILKYCKPFYKKKRTMINSKVTNAGARVRAKTHAHANEQNAALLHCFILKNKARNECAKTNIV